MINASHNIWSYIRRFHARECGVVTVEFVLIVPIFLMFFLMTYESGMASLRNVMLERGVDVAVRDVRIGKMPNPTRETLRDRICEEAMIIPDCENQMELEMILRDPRNWVDVDPAARCIDRSVAVQPAVTFNNGGNNELLFLRACARFDPVLPASSMSLIGNAIRANSSAAAAGSYALVATTAFVVEPFK